MHPGRHPSTRAFLSAAVSAHRESRGKTRGGSSEAQASA